MDHYAAPATTTYVPPPSSSSSQIQQDPYIYSQQPQYDPSQQHYQYYDYSQTYPNPDPNAAALYQPQQPQPDPLQYDPSQQPYDPSQQQQVQQEHAPIHPPGVPVQTDPTYDPNYAYYAPPTHYQADPNYYYPQQQYAPPPPQQTQTQVGYSDPNMVYQAPPQQWQQAPQVHPGDYGLTSMYPPPNAQAGPYVGSARGGGHSAGRGGGGGRTGGRGGVQAGGRGGVQGGGRGFRGGGSSFRGGRSGGRGGNGIPRIKPEPKPQFLAWCELCRVDCNTHEVLENHLNGKKHKKNVEIQEELKKLAAKTHEAQLAAAAAFEKQEVKLESHPFQSEEQGLKRKTRDSEERVSADPEKKQKEVVPFICELCDVKCESAPTFDSHLKGRKHVYNLQRFQEQQAQAALGQVALQALYPALEAALLQALAQNASTSYGYGGGGGGIDQNTLLQLLQPYLPQTGPGFFPQGSGFHPPHGLNLVENQNQVEPVNESEPKTEVEVEQHTQVETDGDQVEPVNETEVEVEPENKNEDDQVETEVEVEPEKKNEDDQVETESKTDQVDSEAAELTQ